ncbi:methylated-DNA--[protein]-cysteine S-methyltransferase [Alphaproteobacteria bacterium]|nr:methylated-DNA--[protein]-cysteine S-methyltransferase [Alphaproteobacteria bacterium]
MQFKENYELLAIHENGKSDRGAGLTIHYGFEDSNYGSILVAKTGRGICWLAIAADKTASFRKMKLNWPLARFVEIDMRDMVSGNISLDLYGTPFQRCVWKALLDIPRGETVSYQDIALNVGRPRATRAVGTAIGLNPVSVIIPCHRVIRQDGGLGGYAWGTDLKREILQAEAA